MKTLLLKLASAIAILLISIAIMSCLPSCTSAKKGVKSPNQIQSQVLDSNFIPVTKLLITQRDLGRQLKNNPRAFQFYLGSTFDLHRDETTPWIGGGIVYNHVHAQSATPGVYVGSDTTNGVIRWRVDFGASGVFWFAPINASSGGEGDEMIFTIQTDGDSIVYLKNKYKISFTNDITQLYCDKRQFKNDVLELPGRTIK